MNCLEEKEAHVIRAVKVNETWMKIMKDEDKTKGSRTDGI